MEIYFTSPTQVMFADPDNPGSYQLGIAYKDEIICGCCGGIFEIDEIEPDKIYPYNSWEDICFAISGGEFPDNFPLKTESDEEDAIDSNLKNLI